MLTEGDSAALKSWFLQNARKLPWRENKSPYRVWVSEVMLQQTQVKTVLAYFERWFERFPNIETLARANEEEVTKAWEGLGYYRRARSLLEGAKYLVDHYGGQLPSTKEELLKVPGIGSYTASAILSFAFGKAIGVLDGNVARVLTRYFALADCIDSAKTKRALEDLALRVLPENEPSIFAEALMELGARVCKPKPDCLSCPLQTSCKAYQNESQESYPVKKERPAITALHRTALVIQTAQSGELLVNRVEKGQVMEGLYEFPYLEGKVGVKSIRKHLEKLSCKVIKIEHLANEKQSFTRFSVSLFGYLIQIESKSCEGQWRSYEELSRLAFSSGHRRLLAHFKRRRS